MFPYNWVVKVVKSSLLLSCNTLHRWVATVTCWTVDVWCLYTRKFCSFANRLVCANNKKVNRIRTHFFSLTLWRCIMTIQRACIKSKQQTVYNLFILDSFALAKDASWNDVRSRNSAAFFSLHFMKVERYVSVWFDNPNYIHVPGSFGCRK